MTSATVALEGDQLVIRHTKTNGSGSSGAGRPVGATQFARSANAFISSGSVAYLFRPTDSSPFGVVDRATLVPIDGGKRICPQGQDVPGVGAAQLSADGRTLQFVTGTAIGVGTSCSQTFVQIAWTQVLTRAA